MDVELGKQAEWLAEYHQAELKKLSELRARYIKNPMLHEALDEALALRKKVRANLVEHFQSENLPCEPGGFALHFWPCWFEADGKAKGSARASRAVAHAASDNKPVSGRRPEQTGRCAPQQHAGFDGIIGNPPWEGFKPIRKEFAAKLLRGKPQFSKMGMDGPTFDKWFAEELKTNAGIRRPLARARGHTTKVTRNSSASVTSIKAPATGTCSSFSSSAISRWSGKGGQFSLLVPVGFQTDEGCADLRRWLITEHRLDELTSFENRGYTRNREWQGNDQADFPRRGQPLQIRLLQSRQRRGHRRKTTLSTGGFICTTRRMRSHADSLRR